MYVDTTSIFTLQAIRINCICYSVPYTEQCFARLMSIFSITFMKLDILLERFLKSSLKGITSNLEKLWLLSAYKKEGLCQVLLICRKISFKAKSSSYSKSVNFRH